MRAYLPLTLSDLQEPTPPRRRPVLIQLKPGATADQVEEALESALEDAAFASLQLEGQLRRTPCRVVAVGDVPADRPELASWKQVESLMVDLPEARIIASQVLEEEDEQTANALVEDLFEHPLGWHDASERAILAQEL